MKRLSLLTLGVLVISGIAIFRTGDKPQLAAPTEPTAQNQPTAQLPTAPPRAHVPTAAPQVPVAKRKLAPLDYRWIQDLLRDGKRDEAIRLLKKELEEDPNDVPRLTELAMILMTEAADRSEAMSLFQKAIGLDPENSPAIEGVTALVSEGKETAEVLQSLVQRYPESAAIAQAYGRALSEEGREAQAIPQFEKALSKNPTDNNLSAELANAYQNAGQWEKAIAQHEKVIAEKERVFQNSNESRENTAYLEKTIVDQKLDLAETFIGAGKFQEAENLLKQLSHQYPRDTGVSALIRLLTQKRG